MPRTRDLMIRRLVPTTKYCSIHRLYSIGSLGQETCRQTDTASRLRVHLFKILCKGRLTKCLMYTCVVSVCNWPSFAHRLQGVHQRITSAFTFFFLLFSSTSTLSPYYSSFWCHAVAPSVEALRCKQEGGGFNSRCCQVKFFIDITLPPTLWPCGRPSL